MRRLALLVPIACLATYASGREDLVADGVQEETLFRAGRNFAWVRALEADIRREPANADLHASLALGYFLLSQRRFAGEEIELALKLAPDSLQANYIAGRIAMDADNDYRSAIPRFRRVLSISSGNFKARYFLGVCLRNLGRHAEALEQFRAASIHSPYDWAFTAIAEEDLGAGHARDALEAALKALHMNNSAENLLLAGKCWQALGETQKALDCFQQAAKIDADWDTPHYFIARIEAKLPGGADRARAENARFEALRDAAR